MAAFTKFNCLPQDLARKVHDLSADSLKAMLSSVVPSVNNAVKADLTEIAAGNGYTAGGKAVPITSCAQTGGVLKLVLGNPSPWVAAGGAMAPFRYVELYNDTPAGKNLIGFYDYGSVITLQDGEQFQLSFDATAGALTIS